jgi:NAD(P)-dependent dehydrogenase (short-subunit alcohol dehydrogenase family)
MFKKNKKQMSTILITGRLGNVSIALALVLIKAFYKLVEILVDFSASDLNKIAKQKIISFIKGDVTKREKIQATYFKTNTILTLKNLFIITPFWFCNISVINILVSTLIRK